MENTLYLYANQIAQCKMHRKYGECQPYDCRNCRQAQILEQTNKLGPTERLQLDIYAGVISANMEREERSRRKKRATPKLLIAWVVLMLLSVWSVLHASEPDEKLYEALWYTYVYATDWDGDGQITCRDDAFTMVHVYRAIGGKKDMRMAKAYILDDQAAVYVVYDNRICIEPVSPYTWITWQKQEPTKQKFIADVKAGKVPFKMEDCWNGKAFAFMRSKNRFLWDMVPKDNIYDRPIDDEVLQSVVMWHGTDKCRYPPEFCAGWAPFDWLLYNSMLVELGRYR